jgi:type VI secretion system VgrG family protein
MASTTYDYTFDCQALNGLLRPASGPASSVIVTHWQGTEAVSRLYRFDITFAAGQGDLTLEKILNQPATLTARTPDGGTRQWHGVITQASEEGRDETHYYYQVTLEPRMARLRNMCWSDIYLKRDLADLIKQILAYAGLDQPYSTDNAPYDYRISATGLAQTQTDFTCQFEESCLDFLMRKLEFYGVYFWFEQGSSQESVVFANDVSQQPGAPDNAVWYPRGTIDPDARQIAIMRLKRRVGIPLDAVVLHDTTEQNNTAVTLSRQASVPRPGSAQALGEVHSVDDHFLQLDGNNSVSGATLATWRAQEAACRRMRVEGEARTPGIRAGRFLTISESVRGSKAKDYYVIEVTHEGTQTLETQPETSLDTYRAAFVALPRSLDPDNASDPLQYRPPRATPVPHVTRLLNGFIDIATPGSPKRFAQPDSDGCYKVRFLFARQRYDGEQNSAFLRMATPYAGGASSPGLSNAGMHFPLREGTEVLIAFVNGNPDRPVIVSALPNTEAPSVVNAKNSAHHSIATPGGNTVVLADAAPGGEGAPAVRLFSPVDESSLNLGTSDEEGVADGWHLTTQNHGEMYCGSSLLLEVPGHYRVAAGGSMSGFLGSEAQGLPSGISAGQSGGIVIENFLGMKIESVEAITVENFFGAKAEMCEAIAFETTLGAKFAVEAVFAKELNLVEKAYIHDSSTTLSTLKSWVTSVWNGVAAEKSDKVGQMNIEALENYTLLTPTAYLGSPTASLALDVAGAQMIGETMTFSSMSTVVVNSEAAMTLTAGGATVLALTPAGATLDGAAVALNSLGNTDIVAAGYVNLDAPLVAIG